MAQLQKERIDALKKAQDELERLSRAKSKALDHLAHELRTPISLMMGTIKILKGKLARHYPEFKAEGFFEVMEKNLVRISDTQQETDKIVRTSLDAESRLIVDEFDHLWRHIESVSELTDEIKGMFRAIREWIVRFVPSSSTTLQVIPLHEFLGERIKEARTYALHRDLSLYLESESNLSVIMEPTILKDVVSGLIKMLSKTHQMKGLFISKLNIQARSCTFGYRTPVSVLRRRTRLRYSMGCFTLWKQTSMAPEGPMIFMQEVKASIFSLQKFTGNASVLKYY